MPMLMRDAQLLAVDVELLGDRGQQPLGQRLGGRRLLAVGRDDGELVAAEPRQERAADRRLQAPRHLAQQAVADGVAEHVVDLLEAVEVERHQRERAAVLGRASRWSSSRHSLKAARLGRPVSAS